MNRRTLTERKKTKYDRWITLDLRYRSIPKGLDRLNRFDNRLDNPNYKKESERKEPPVKPEALPDSSIDDTVPNEDQIEIQEPVLEEPTEQVETRLDLAGMINSLLLQRGIDEEITVPAEADDDIPFPAEDADEGIPDPDPVPLTLPGAFRLDQALSMIPRAERDDYELLDGRYLKTCAHYTGNSVAWKLYDLFSNARIGYLNYLRPVVDYATKFADEADFFHEEVNATERFESFINGTFNEADPENWVPSIGIMQYVRSHMENPNMRPINVAAITNKDKIYKYFYAACLLNYNDLYRSILADNQVGANPVFDAIYAAAQTEHRDLLGESIIFPEYDSLTESFYSFEESDIPLEILDLINETDDAYFKSEILNRWIKEAHTLPPDTNRSYNHWSNYYNMEGKNSAKAKYANRTSKLENTSHINPLGHSKVVFTPKIRGGGYSQFTGTALAYFYRYLRSWYTGLLKACRAWNKIDGNEYHLFPPTEARKTFRKMPTFIDWLLKDQLNWSQTAFTLEEAEEINALVEEVLAQSNDSITKALEKIGALSEYNIPITIAYDTVKHGKTRDFLSDFPTTKSAENKLTADDLRYRRLRNTDELNFWMNDEYKKYWYDNEEK